MYVRSVYGRPFSTQILLTLNNTLTNHPVAKKQTKIFLNPSSAS